MADQLKLVFAHKISASAVKVTTNINDTMNKKINQLNNKLNEIGARVSETKALAENNTSRLEQIKITNSKLEKFSKKIEQLEELIDDQINQNTHSVLITHGVKFTLCNEKSWNDMIMATTLYT